MTEKNDRKMDAKEIEYFEIEGTPGGNQEWCSDFWMYLGGCGALAACDLSICLAKNKEIRACCPYYPETMTKKEYVDFSMKMKPYIHPRMGGVDKISIFTDEYGKYLSDCGYQATFSVCEGEQGYEEACEYIISSLEKNMPVAFLLLRHRDKKFKDLNWHWFMITGYSIKGNQMNITYHTYGEKQEISFKELWNTGMFRKGGMVSLDTIVRNPPVTE